VRIHFFITSLRKGGGGSHQNVIAYVRMLRSLGHRVVVHTLLDEESNDPPEDIVLFCAPQLGRSFLHMQRIVSSELTRFASEADIFFVYGQALLWGAGAYRKKGKIPVVVYLDSHLDSMKEAYRSFGFLHRIKHRAWEVLCGLRLARNIDTYIATSPYLAERYVQSGFLRKKMVVVPNAFAFPPVGHVPPSDICSILYVGRFSYEKGVDFLVDALSLMKDARWRARIVGSGPERERILSMIKERSFADRIEVLPWLSAQELEEEYARASVLVVPSRVPEPFGRTIVEAMHAGLPVVVPRHGGAAWVAGKAGVTFENGDTSSLSDALCSLVSDLSHREALGRAGVKRADVFSSSRVGAQLVEVLQRLLDGVPL